MPFLTPYKSKKTSPSKANNKHFYFNLFISIQQFSNLKRHTCFAMSRLQTIRFKTISVLYAFTFITSIFFLHSVDARDILKLRPTRDEASVLTSKIAPEKIIVVDINGPESSRSIQDAIDSIPDGNPNWVVIHVKKGVYRYFYHRVIRCTYHFMKNIFTTLFFSKIGKKWLFHEKNHTYF